ncbi:hypothetical protein Dsin_025161 [Dipteronia sinensis]|uniref:ADP-ribosyl cyclase/cyclic ADP-ribose hydrolase n=1 Tax=Dipteronia sinensis TaxID=43782 RepID=A0AAD9ZVW3_9ROSI|nr:hypothetical protein Dsin_025161 [Dipteronia sinensis]
MVASSSTCSSSTITNYDRKYDVFLSFRGENSTSDSFKSHLCGALSQKHIETFVDDDKLNRGDETSPALLKAIEESKISVVIFSKDYASSKGCLRELAEIIKYKKKNKQIVIPVFYQVNPSDVRKQTGSFNDAFTKHNKQVSGEELQTWKTALTEASNLSGFDSSVTRPESRLVDEIVKDVLKKLNFIFASADFRGLVGIDSRVESVKSLLCMETADFRVVGIWGMGGIGKTTIAGAVFNQISCQFDGCCYFVANVREESENCGGLVRLRDEILSQILGEKLNLGTPNIPPLVKRRIQSKKVFIVLDDMNSLKQLEILAGGLDGFGLGSRIIITTRDKQLLNFVAAFNIYDVASLDKNEALQLFCNCAFKEDHIPKDLMVFARRAVDYAKGNPLALKVLGSSLYRKSEQDWESALHKLHKIPNLEIHSVLRIGYEALDREETNILLDIACFFNGQNGDYSIQILNACYFSTQAGLSVLVDKCLITISENKIKMHDLLQEMCWEIVRQESFNNPGERSRLHNHEDIFRVLKRNTGTESVKGILLDMSKIKNVDLSAQAFEKMCNLRFLNFYDWSQEFGDPTNACKVQLPYGLNYLPDGLRYFHWLRYPSKVLPSKLNLDHLVELNLFESNVEQLWEGKQDVPMLRRLILGLSRNLTRIPDLSGSPYLEVIDLINCKSLLEISSSIQHLNNLHVLRLEGCESHSSFSSNIRFESLRNLDLSLCSSVMKFPQISGNIEMLSLNGTEIEEVPSSIENLSKLSFLDLSDCTRLKHISTNICKLKCLRSLILKNCFKLESFPEILEKMESMEILDLSYCSKLVKFPKNIVYLSSLEQLVLRGNNFESLPESIRQLSNLRELWLNDCNKLQSLTVLPLGLRYLEAESCEQLQSLPDASNFAELVTSAQSISRGSCLNFIFTNCLKLSDQKECSNILAELLPIIKHMATTEKELQKEVNIDICYPGNEIPDWFSYLSFGSSMFIQLPQHNGCNRKILGVALCVVIAFKECCFNDLDYLRVRVPFVCCVHPRTIYRRLVKLKGYLTVREDREYTDKISIDMDHVVLGYRSYPNVKILEDDYATCTVKFLAPDEGQNCKVKYCGVSLVYAEPEIIQPRISVEKFGSTNQDSGETMVEEIPNEAETSQRENGSGNGRSEDEEKDPQPKPVTGNKSMLLINGKVGPFYCTLCDRFGLLRCYCWNFLVYLFYRLCALYGETNKIQPCISPEKFNATNQASEETMVESNTKFPNEADTSARGSGKSAHFINNKVFLLHHTLLKGVGLLHCCCWSFLVCLFGGLCVFGLLGLLVLHLSTRCEIYLSYHAQNMQVRKI